MNIKRFQDALKRKRTFRNLRASLIVKLMIFLPPAYYCASVTNFKKR